MKYQKVDDNLKSDNAKNKDCKALKRNTSEKWHCAHGVLMNSYKQDKLPDNNNLSSPSYCSIQEGIKRHELMYTSMVWITSSLLRGVTDNTILPVLPYSCHTWHYELKILFFLQRCKRMCLLAAIYFIKFLKQTHNNNFWIVRKQ